MENYKCHPFYLRCEKYLPIYWNPGLSLDENIGMFVCKLNEIVEVVNEVKQEMEDFINTYKYNIEQVVRKIMNEWKNDGFFDEIINTWTDESVKCYGTLQELKSRTDLTIGNLVRTTGYWADNDGGQGVYLISSKGNYTNNNGTVISLKNNLVGLLQNNGITTLNQWGAKGDGKTDDSNYINNAFQKWDNLAGNANATYYITNSLTFKYGVNFNGYGCKFIANYNTFVNVARGNLPTKVLIFFENRNPNVFGDEKRGAGRYFKNFKVENISDNVQNDMCGIYAGYIGPYTTKQETTVNYSFANYTVDNITIDGFTNCMILSEAWENKFSNITIFNVTNGIRMWGQCVNNVFTNCEIIKHNNATTNGVGLLSNIETWQPIQQESQGNLFTNLTILSQPSRSILMIKGGEFMFNNAILDLCQSNSVYIANTAYELKFTNCYLQSTNDSLIIANGANENLHNSFLGCEFISGKSSHCVSQNSSKSEIFTNCIFHQKYYSSGSAKAIINNCTFFTNPYFEGSGIVVGFNNTLAADGSVLAPTNKMAIYTNTNASANFLYGQLFNGKLPFSVGTTDINSCVNTENRNSVYEISASDINGPEPGTAGVALMVNIGSAYGIIAWTMSGKVFTNTFLTKWTGWKKLTN